MNTPVLRYPKLAKIRDGVGFYKHQVEGINRLSQQQNFLLADEMGLGKSLQALTVAAIDFERGVADRVLVVCTNSIKYNWLDEIELHTNFKAMVLDGTPDKRYRQLELFIDGTYEVLIVNYEQVVKHVGDFNDISFDIVIYDEAHSIKNKDAKRTKACMGLVASRYFALTGSPMLNRVNELWTILHRLAPDQFPKYYPFVYRYCIFGGYENREIIGVKHQRELRDKIAPLMLRRLKADVLDDLPDKLPIKQEWLDLTPLQRKMYKQAEDELQIQMPSDEMNVLEINSTLTRFLRLKQIASTTATIDPATDSSSKLDRLEEIVDEICFENRQGLVVFTQFRGTLQAIFNRLHTKLPTYVMHGDMKPEDRQEAIRNWSAHIQSGYPAVLVPMLQVGGVGLNLVAASTVVFVDKLYVPKLNEQAIDRLHRIGQTKQVQVIELLCRGTVERRIERLLNRKNVVFRDIIEDASNDTGWKRKLIEAMRSKDDD